MSSSLIGTESAPSSWVPEAWQSPQILAGGLRLLQLQVGSLHLPRQVREGGAWSKQLWGLCTSTWRVFQGTILQTDCSTVLQAESLLAGEAFLHAPGAHPLGWSHPERSHFTCSETSLWCERRWSRDFLQKCFSNPNKHVVTVTPQASLLVLPIWLWSNKHLCMQGYSYKTTWGFKSCVSKPGALAPEKKAKKPTFAWRKLSKSLGRWVWKKTATRGIHLSQTYQTASCLSSFKYFTLSSFKSTYVLTLLSYAKCILFCF